MIIVLIAMAGYISDALENRLPRHTLRYASKSADTLSPACLRHRQGPWTIN